MSTYDWLTSARINALERITGRLAASIYSAVPALKDNAALITDSSILATQAYLMYFHQLATMSPDPREFRDFTIRTLKAQGLSAKTLKEIEQWTATACDAIDGQGHDTSDTIHSVVSSKRKQEVLVS